MKVDHRVVAVIGSEDDFAMLRKLDVLMVSTWSDLENVIEVP